MTRRRARVPIVSVIVWALLTPAGRETVMQQHIPDPPTVTVTQGEQR